MKKLALLLALLMIGAATPAATVAAAVVKPVAQQAPALPVPKRGTVFPTYTTLYASNYHPAKNVNFYLGGTVTYLYAGKTSGAPNNSVYSNVRFYNERTKSWGGWLFPVWLFTTNSKGIFGHNFVYVGPPVQFQAVFRGTNTLRASTSKVITID